jgi:hypothetical protein
MRKKLTLTIDSDVYDVIKELPRTVSISEVVSFVLKAMYEDVKKGRESTDEELDAWIRSNPELTDFRERLREHWGPGISKINHAVEKVKGAVTPNKAKKK